MTTKTSNFKLIAMPVIVMTIIALITATLLALTNSFTAPVIEELGKRKIEESRKELLPAATSFSADKTGEIGDSSFTYIEGLDGSGNVVGYIFTNSSPGYAKPVTVMMGVDLDGAIVGVKPIDLAETPGLGMNAEKPEFLGQFIGKSDEVGVNKTAASDTEVMALSGATVTSAAFASSVNKGLEQFFVIGGGEIKEPQFIALPEAITFGAEKSGTLDGAAFTYLEGLDEAGNIIGYVFTTAAEGYHGLVTIMTGVDPDGMITGVEPFSHDETPGLGSKIEDDSFKSQFIGKSVEVAGVDGISNATYSSEAVLDAVNIALKQFATLSGGGQ